MLASGSGACSVTEVTAIQSMVTANAVKFEFGCQNEYKNTNPSPMRIGKVWWKGFELIRTVKSGWCFFKVETQFVSAVYNVKHLKMDCLVYGYIQHLHRAFRLVNFDFASR